jgi:signal transduction histidine kinase
MAVSTPIDERRFEQLRRLTEISRALTYTTSLDQVLRLAVDRALELLDADKAILMLADSDGLLRVAAARGVEEQRIDQFREPLDENLLHRLHGLLGNVVDPFIGVPLVVQGEVTGLLAVVRMAGPDSREADEWLLSALADQAAVALENARLAGEVRLELQARLHAVQGVSEARDKALTTLSHDLRTPLTAIDSYAELLEMGIYGPVQDRQLEALGRIRISGRHLLSVLENVMEMARLSAGVIRLEPRDLAVADIVRDAVSILQPGADAKEQRLEVKITGDVRLHADSGRLQQVVVNLLGNAIKYTPAQGSIRIETSIAPRKGKKNAAIKIIDSGVGIPKEMLVTIFEPYFRVQATASEPGVGLGLAISRELMRHMGGDITVTSTEGSGSTFVAWLPLG